MQTTATEDIQSEGKHVTALSVEGASGHIALCIADELLICSGIEGLATTMLCLAKVLASLPLPENDQVLTQYQVSHTIPSEIFLPS